MPLERPAASSHCKTHISGFQRIACQRQALLRLSSCSWVIGSVVQLASIKSLISSAFAPYLELNQSDRYDLVSSVTERSSRVLPVGPKLNAQQCVLSAVLMQELAVLHV